MEYNKHKEEKHLAMDALQRCYTIEVIESLDEHNSIVNKTFYSDSYRKIIDFMSSRAQKYISKGYTISITETDIAVSSLNNKNINWL